MEEMRKVALAYFENLSNDQKQEAKQYFKKIDVSGDGKISLGEFKFFMREKGPSSQTNSEALFKWLDLDDSGSLDFEEIITLYYLENHMVVTCDVCDEFLLGAYFSCFQCFYKTPITYDLCCDCYRGKKYRHHSDAVFFDNQTLLHQSKRVLQETTQAEEGVSMKDMAITAVQISSAIMGCPIQ